MSDREETAPFQPATGWFVVNAVVVIVLIALTVILRTLHSPVWNWIPDTVWEDVIMITRIGGPLAGAFCLNAMRRIGATTGDRLLRLSFVFLNIIGFITGLHFVVY